MTGLSGLDARDIDALSFDIYGTILDWEPEIRAFLVNWLVRHRRQDMEAGILDRYDRLRQPIQSMRPMLAYPEVLRRTLAELGTELDVPVTEKDLRVFSGLAARHRPFPDSRKAMAMFRGNGLKLAALSNIDEASFSAAMTGAGLVFDVAVTAERVGAYKPDHAHFHTVLADLAALGILRERVLHVAQSLRADIVPANVIGIRCVWIDRPGHLFGREGQGAEVANPDFVAGSLAELATHLSSV